MAITWAENYAPVVLEAFNAGKDMVPDMIPQLFDVKNSTKGREDAIGVGAASGDWDAYANTGKVDNADLDRGYATMFEHEVKGLEFVLKREDIDDNNLGIVQIALQQLGISAEEKRQRDAASIFNNAFSSSYVGADGVSLCNAAHPYGPDNEAQTYSNAGTAALTYDNVKAARLAMRKFVDSQGQKLPRKGSLILSGIELEDKLLEITAADKKPGTAENDANAIMGFKYLIWDYIDDADNWFLLDPVWTKMHLRWYNRVPLRMSLVEQNEFYAKWQFYMRYSCGWVDPRFVYGNNVT